MSIIFFTYNLNLFKYSNLYDGLMYLSKSAKIHIIGGGYIPKGVKVPKNIIIHSIKKPRFKTMKNLFFTIKMLFKSLKIIKSNKINVIFVLNDIFPQILSYFICKLTKIPYFVDYRGNVSYERELDLKKFSFLKKLIRLYLNRSYDALEDFTLKKAKAVICNNHLSKKLLLRRSINNDKLHVIWHGVNLEKFNSKKYSDKEKSLLKTNLKLKSDDFIYLFIGRLVPNKGLFYLLRAMKELKVEFPKIKLLIVGYGPLEKELKEFAIKNEIFEVKFLGKQSHDKIPIFYAISNSFVLPTLSEGLPNVVLEAMASAIPVISTKVGDVPRLIGKSKNGNILIDSRDLEQLVSGMKQFYENRNDLTQIGRNNREFILNNISWKHFAIKLIKLFKFSS